MQYRGLNELREMYLSFFETKGHLRLPSFSLIPQNDPSLLLINSGMAPMKPYFTGEQEPPRHRVTTCQKCIRTGDIENIGHTARHGTYFEMLGNFSFGDYFKNEAIHWAWEFLTSPEWVGLDPNRLYPSVFAGNETTPADDEAFAIWRDEIGIPEDRIFKFGKEDNFWEHGSGPCGPCSEIYYDRGEKYGCGKPGCTVGCDCDRYMEVWNVVFSQFDNDGHDHYTELKQKNIDTGMGLERLAVVCQDVDSLFDVDTVMNITNKVTEITGASYGQSQEKDVSLRVITDHIRSASFMICDGVLPSNEGRGYVLRRLLRRAARHGKLLGVNRPFLYEVVDTVVHENEGHYPELRERQAYITKVIRVEEENFSKTIDGGMKIFDQLLAEHKEKGETTFSGADAFKLYDTYGFPIDLTKEILEEKGFSIDEDGFNAAMQKQREMARKARKATNYMGADATVYESLDPAITSSFVGYDKLEAVSRISALTTEDEVVEALTDGDKGTIIVDATPFYGTMGGQEGDKGVITSADGKFAVEDTIHLKGGKIGHVGYVVSGMFKLDDEVTLSVDKENRSATCKNHTATHLLQKALRDVLGTHVEQQGSLNNAGHLRFDFSHFSAMTAEELEQVEKAVNEKIAENIPVVTKLMTLDEAKKSGAMALFGEKYGDTVRVVCVDDYSKEFCGGTHVSNTGEIQAFKILSESGVAAGVRRIEALTGQGVFDYYNDLEKKLEEAAKTVKATPANLQEKLEHLMADLKSLQAENESLKSKAAKEALGDVMDQVQDVNGVKLLAVSVADVDMNGLRDLGDQLKEKLGEGVVVLASAKDGKVNLIAMATDAAMKQGAHAGNLIKGIAALVGGGGGGRPNMAQAGGKNPAGIDAAIAEAAKVLAGQIDK